LIDFFETGIKNKRETPRIKSIKSPPNTQLLRGAFKNRKIKFNTRRAKKKSVLLIKTLFSFSLRLEREKKRKKRSRTIKEISPTMNQKFMA